MSSDDGRDWKWRPPPRGFTSDNYTLCEARERTGSCQYGAQCVEAHGAEELAEWKERFEFRKMKMQRACEKELHGKSYTEQLLDKWIQATSPEKVMREKLDVVEETCSADLVTTVSSKVSKRDWTFVLRTKRTLRAVALLQDAHRNHFCLKQIFPGEPKPNKKGGHKIVEAELASDQEWTSKEKPAGGDPERGPTLEHRIKVTFSTDIYGTFRQSVVFDLGAEPVLVKHLCVDVVPVTDADKLKEIRKEIARVATKRWDGDNSDVVAFSSPVYPGLSTPYGKEASGDKDKELLGLYPPPRADTLCLTQATFAERHVTRNNYRTRMHELLYVEELARCEQVANYNLTCKLRIAPSYLLSPSGMATTAAKYAHSGELFALLTLGKDISEDTSAGRLILNNCTTVLLTAGGPANDSARRRVYESLIEDKGKNMIYLRLSAISVRELNMRADTDFTADIQFQLNRVTYCEWHYAIDRITDYRLIFPDTSAEVNITWSPTRQWDDSLDFRLNVKQKEAVLAITAPVGAAVPPILIIGPFGTGKTYTLAQAIKKLLHQPDSKILICTHSNSAADLYIKDFLHPWLEAGITDAKPLRIYYHKRWVSTVDEIVQQYCLIELKGGVRSFQLPTLEEVLKHRIVVVTLSISMYLSTLGIPKGYFTHILLDEAAQAMESEALMPLALATPTTRIVLAGDHMQLSPEIFSQFARERNLHLSLLERLYEHYPGNFPCKILLCENYRAHEAIIKFTSELFYEQMLIASGKQPRHSKFYPLTFFTTRGEDVQDQNSTAFYNNSEVYEVVERVYELRSNWPSSWGKLDDQSIGIMTPYADQVFRIRSELRKRRMGGISVERVLNVQGKQFRAIFLSTVRTRRTCQAAAELDYGFLSNRKLLNTAITRAQSLVAVVGDPVALCSIGRCRKVWERFISICNENDSLFGITWNLLRSQLDGVELKKTYTLNPLAPEFVPRALQAEAYIKLDVNEMSGPPLVQSSSGMNIPLPIAQMNAIARQPNPQSIPQLINTANGPVLPYPVYFYPGGAGQPPHGANVFPMNRAPIPQQTVPMSNIPTHQANSINPWTVNSFPLASPNDRSTPTWSKQAQKKPPDINSTIVTNLRAIHRTIPQRFTGTSAHLLAPQLLANKNTQFIPMPPGQQRVSPDNLSNTNSVINENYMANDLIAPNIMRNTQVNMPPDRVVYQPNVAKLQEPAILNASKEKEQIQFLQNVHFPERARDLPPPLPPGISLQDPANDNPEFQMRWYHHLLDTQGIEAASKYIDFVAQRRLVPPPSIKPAVPSYDTYLPANEFRNAEEMLTDKNMQNTHTFMNYNFQNGQGLVPPVNELDRQWQGNISQYVNSKPFLREFENMMVPNNGMYGNNIPRDEKVLNQRNYVPNDPLELPWQSNNQAQSVPLYRRQVGQTNHSAMIQSEPPLPQSLLDTLDKSNSTTGAFAGYARAFSLQQNEPANMAHHNSILMPDRMMNGNVGLVDYRLLAPPLPPQRLQQSMSDYSRPLNGTSLENVDNNDSTTYASVLRQNTPKLEEDKIDPMSALREFGHKSQSHGLYHYFN